MYMCVCTCIFKKRFCKFNQRCVTQKHKMYPKFICILWCFIICAESNEETFFYDNIWIIISHICTLWGLAGSVVRNPLANAGDSGSSLGRKHPVEEEMGDPTPVPLPGKSHGQRSSVGHSPWRHRESDTTERLSTEACCTPLLIITYNLAKGEFEI